MNDLVECRSSDVIAAEINGIKEQVKKTVRGTMLSGAMEIGRLLLEAKAVVQHGEWGQWLQENVDYSQTTANDMMRLYTEYRDQQITLDGGPTNEELFGMLEPSKALALLSLPEQERKEFVQEHPVEDMSVRALKEEIAQIKAEKEAAEAAASAAESAREAAEALIEKKEERAEALLLEAERKQREAEEKAESLQKSREKDLKAAVDAEREKLQKQLKTTRENLDKALKREEEKEKQIDLLKSQLEEAEEKEEVEEPTESPEVVDLRQKVERLERELRAADPAYAKFGALLEQYQSMFYDLVDIANGADDPGSRAKMREILSRVQAGFTAELTEE